MQKKSAKKGTKGVGEPNKTMDSSGGSVPKKARTTTTAKEEEEIFNVFSLEMDSLECDVCFLPFESQIYSCKNGHAACGSCCISMRRKCPTCSEPVGDFRCRAMEKILAGMTRPCRFNKHGCTETVRYTEARAHEEEACRFAPYSCPFDGCAYRGRLLYGHILDAHAPAGDAATFKKCTTSNAMVVTVTLQKSTPFRTLLHPDEESVFLLLNGGDVPTARSLSVVRVCPYGAEVDQKAESTAGVLLWWSLSARLELQFVRQLQGYKAKRFLFVPDDFWGSTDSLDVTVCLW
ncbi:E3 ubiquitin-protein ligase SINA-like 7 [Hordeum vulgare subsp. vulgare]|uniref:RING-type E3 ubiquitin transferase n=1 Tax=Hordeum vulgare subsp. vulgare TaxID=112509 RepID=A0A8I6XKD0_HORVV|nr:E3 ubiquitin-protein ligase SINA-like 7 [Hordeum vulgare subsp. vulgare]